MGITSGNYSIIYFVKYDFFLFQVQSLLYMNTPSFRHLRVSSSQKNRFAVSVIREARTSYKGRDIFTIFSRHAVGSDEKDKREWRWLRRAEAKRRGAQGVARRENLVGASATSCSSGLRLLVGIIQDRLVNGKKQARGFGR